ncbi:MAG: PTS transporter subunit EIIC, partial [Atopobiaceae bacterium]|nr:PTS transporter subunit EIIC [Atopobiaceae bacterium]
MMFTMPLIIVGAVYLLLFQLPIESAANFITSLGIVPFLSHGYTSTFQIIAMVCAIGVGYTWAKNEGWEPLSAGVISLAVFLILIPDYVGAVISTVDGVTTVSAADTITAAEAAATDGAVAATVSGLNKTWLAGQGMIGAILAGLASG